MPPKASTSKSSGAASSSKTTTVANDAPSKSGSLPSDLLTSFLLQGEHARSYKNQYANVYFMRLAKLKAIVLENAQRKWADVENDPVYVPRVLDVQKGKLCYIVGTVYMDMPLKPNVLADIGKEHWVQAPAPLQKLTSPTDTALLEDDSGRVKLVLSPSLKEAGVPLVTGVIMACLGMESSVGEFEVLDICFAGMAKNAEADKGKEKEDERMEIDGEISPKGKWIALVSGLDISSSDIQPGDEVASSAELRLQMLVEYLKGEFGGEEDQKMSKECGAVVILGNSLDIPRKSADDAKNAKRYNQQATYDPAPLAQLSSTLKDLASSIPIHLLPGATDPAGAILPQQPMPRAMFGFEPGVGIVSGVFQCECNPAWIDLGVGNGLLATSGQNLDDVFKYLESEDRLGMARAMMQWRHIAPTCPDTLWCYPFFDGDPFLLDYSPGIYAVGNQPSFASSLVESEVYPGDDETSDAHRARTRVILVPRFSTSGEVVFVHSTSLEIKTMRFGVASGWGNNK
ncbi:hypothetical protein DL93DRAFT_358754 [Clavulina sp. PMI_390]|nr:hypothetical protein DL93DRAFT_358754 [Clavulina sp. PMI_390]